MRSLTQRRIDKGEKAVENSDERNEVFFITKSGYIRREVLTKEELHQNGYHWTEQSGDIFFEGATNPVKEIEWDPTEDWNEGSVEGFIPCTEWKRFRDQKAIDEAFHRKTERSIPWRMLLVLGLVALAALILTQGGFI